LSTGTEVKTTSRGENLTQMAVEPCFKSDANKVKTAVKISPEEI
jgi:hypothetical protein